MTPRFDYWSCVQNLLEDCVETVRAKERIEMYRYTSEKYEVQYQIEARQEGNKVKVVGIQINKQQEEAATTTAMNNLVTLISDNKCTKSTSTLTTTTIICNKRILNNNWWFVCNLICTSSTTC